MVPAVLHLAAVHRLAAASRRWISAAVLAGLASILLLPICATASANSAQTLQPTTAGGAGAATRLPQADVFDQAASTAASGGVSAVSDAISPPFEAHDCTSGKATQGSVTRSAHTPMIVGDCAAALGAARTADAGPTPPTSRPVSLPTLAQLHVACHEHGTVLSGFLPW